MVAISLPDQTFTCNEYTSLHRFCRCLCNLPESTLWLWLCMLVEAGNDVQVQCILSLNDDFTIWAEMAIAPQKDCCKRSSG